MRRRSLLGGITALIGGGAAAVPKKYRMAQIKSPKYNPIAFTRVSVDELRSIPVSDIVDGMFAFVAGQVTLGDGDGGVYIFDPNSTDPDDNLETVAPQGLTTGRWNRLISNVSGGDVAKLADLASTDTVSGTARVGFIQDKAGAVARTAQGKLRETVSIMDFIPENLHAGIYARTDTKTDHTTYVQAALDSGVRLWAPSQVRLNVTQVTIAGLGRFFDFNNMQLVGIASTPTNSVVQIKCGHSDIIGLNVGVGFNLNYRCAAHWYTNDVTQHYVGYNRFQFCQFDGAKIGLVIGGLPVQTVFGTTPVADGNAQDAPLSESVMIGIKTTGCIRGVFMNQPNGKVPTVGCHWASEPNDWIPTYASLTECAAIVVANEGSELHVQGGSVEALQEATGSFIEVNAGHITVDGAHTETVVPIYMASNARVELINLHNGGLNSTNRSYVECKSDCTGRMLMSGFQAIMPHANLSNGTAPFIKGVSSYGGASANVPGVIADLTNMAIREPAWRTGTNAAFTLSQGVRVRARDSLLLGFNSAGTTRTTFKELDTAKPNLLVGKVSHSFNGLPPFDIRGTATVGGFDFVVGSAGGYGKVTTNLPTRETGDSIAALKMVSAGGGGTTLFTTPNLPVEPDTLVTLQGYFRSGGTANNLLIRMDWFDFAGAASTTANSYFYIGTEVAFGAGWQHILMRVTAPADADLGKLFVYVENGAQIELANLRVC